MILSDSETYFSVDFESSVFVHEDDIRRFERILVGEEDLTMVQSFVELCVFRSLEGEMPGVEIIRQRPRLEILQFLVVQFLNLGQYSLIADIRRFHSKYYTYYQILHAIKLSAATVVFVLD